MSQRRYSKKVWILAGVMFVVAFVMPVTVHTRTHYTCLLCRAQRTEHSALGCDWQSSATNVFTEWYGLHRSVHEHVWERSSCTRGSNAFGQPTSWACRMIHPIGTMPPDVELAFAKRADESTLDAFFRDIRSADPDTQQQAVDKAWRSTLDTK